MNDLINELLNNYRASKNQPITLYGGVEENYTPEYTENFDRHGKSYYTDENGDRVHLYNGNDNPLMYAGRWLKAKANDIGRYIENSNPESDAYKQKQAITSGIVTAPFGLGATATKAIAGRLAPFVGQKIGQGMAEGIGGGLAGGGIEGLIRGINEGKNPFATALQDAGLGAAGGVGFGLGVGKLGKFFAGRKLKNATPEIRTQYFNDYVDGLQQSDMLGADSIYSKALADYRNALVGKKLNKGHYLDETDDYIDLTNEIEQGASLNDAKNFVNNANNNEIVFETSNPDYLIDMVGNSKKRNHIYRSSKFPELTPEELNRHNVYITNFDKISPKLRQKGVPKKNNKKDKKPNVDLYHYFETIIKDGENTYPITASTEQYIDEVTKKPQLVHLYDLLENKKSPAHNVLPSETTSDTNIITDYDKNLKSFMKNSKVVDENGEPLEVWHGSTEDFDVFDRTKSRANMDIQGNFFSPWKLDAQGYGPNVRNFYLNITNPAPSGVAYKTLNKYKGQDNAGIKAREDLIRQGYDGVNNDNEEFIAFYPEQIKSVQNQGTFDPKNPNIYKAIAPLLSIYGLNELTKEK